MIFWQICILGCPRFCQKLKIQNVTPLRFWIGSNGYQKVQKLENLCMLEGAFSHVYVYEANSLKRIIRRWCYYFKWLKPRKLSLREAQICKKMVQNSDTRGPMISNNLNMAICKYIKNAFENTTFKNSIHSSFNQRSLSETSRFWFLK